jgi:hypothetical protein
MKKYNESALLCAIGWIGMVIVIIIALSSCTELVGKEIQLGITYDVVTIDSCKYILMKDRIGGSMMVHKGNCNNCKTK